MGIYSLNARGIFLYDLTTNVDLTIHKDSLDFVVSYAGYGDRLATNFKVNIQAGRKINKPVLAYFEILPDLYQGMTYAPSKWPTGLNEPHVKALNQALRYDSGIREKLDGIILDISRYKMLDNKTYVTAGWNASLAEHVTNQLFAYFKVPIYPLQKPWNPNETNPVYLEYQEPSSPQSVLFNQWGSISVVKTYSSFTERVEEINIPDYTMGVTPPFVSNWDFWWYGSQVISNVKGSVINFLFSKNKQELAKQLNYTYPDTPVNPPNDPPPVIIPSGVVPSGTYINTDLTETNYQLKRIADSLEKLANKKVTIVIE